MLGLKKKKSVCVMDSISIQFKERIGKNFVVIFFFLDFNLKKKKKGEMFFQYLGTFVVESKSKCYFLHKRMMKKVVNCV